MRTREEVEAINSLWTLLDTYRRNMRLSTHQLSLHTAGFVPPIIINQVRESKSKIAEIKRELRNRYHVNVVDDTIDAFDLTPYTG